MASWYDAKECPSFLLSGVVDISIDPVGRSTARGRQERGVTGVDWSKMQPYLAVVASARYLVRRYLSVMRRSAG
jgi:hypothetical protein